MAKQHRETCQKCGVTVRASDRYKQRKTVVHESRDIGEHSHARCESSDKSSSVSKPLHERSHGLKSNERVSVTCVGTTTEYDRPRRFTFASYSRTSMEWSQSHEASEGGRACDTSAGNYHPRLRGDRRPYRSRRGWRLFRGRLCRGQFNPLPRYHEPFRSQPQHMDNEQLLRRLAFLEQKLGRPEDSYRRHQMPRIRRSKTQR